MATRVLGFDVPHEGVQQVSMCVDEPPAGGPRVDATWLVAHGAGAPMTSPFLQGVAERVAALGVTVVRFQYAYMEQMQRRATQGRAAPRPPDRTSVLEMVHRAAAAFARKTWPSARFVLGGKSLGARIASRVAAGGVACDGLVFLGYPLHPAGKPERLRTEHFPASTAPALFLTGDRDALCDLALLRAALETYAGDATLAVVEGADHGFDVLRRSGRGRDEVLGELCARAVDWIERLPTA